MSAPDTLFLCVANSARSQMAEGLARRLCAQGQRVFSAGSAPSQVNPLAITVMSEIDIDLSDHRSKGVHEVPLDEIDLIITLCPEEVCPAVPAPVDRWHWPLPDPAAQGGDETERLQAFRQVRDEIRQRLEALFGRSMV